MPRSLLALDRLPAGVTGARLTHYRIDETHSNSFTVWKKLGSPVAPDEAQDAQLARAGRLAQWRSRRACPSGTAPRPCNSPCRARGFPCSSSSGWLAPAGRRRAGHSSPASRSRNPPKLARRQIAHPALDLRGTLLLAKAVGGRLGRTAGRAAPD